MRAAHLDEKTMPRQTMLLKIENVLKRGNPTDPPAYTLILGAGASSGIVPTAKEMLGFPDPINNGIHEKSIPLWLERQLNPGNKMDSETARLDCSKNFWKRFRKENQGISLCKNISIDETGFPTTSSIAAAYQSVFETSCVGGLDTPEMHRNYMREVTIPSNHGATQLNATHFYLASLLSLQKRTTESGSNNEPLYRGRREFARTIFTTNFDPLLQTSLQLFQLLYFMTDRPESLSADALQTDHHPITHLFYAHGSVHRPYMANTDRQIELLKKQNARDLAAYMGNHGVIVIGYSGWDDCLLEALNQTKVFSNNLYWLVRDKNNVSENVASFIISHPNAYLVEIDDAGNFMADLHNRLCPGAPNTEMLYNPIRSTLRQLGCLSLKGIRGGTATTQSDSIRDLAKENTSEVEQIRLQVIARLNDAQSLFIAPPKESTEYPELRRQANLCFSNKDWNTALAIFRKILKEDKSLSEKDIVETKLKIGNSQQELEDFKGAIEIYDPIVNNSKSGLYNILYARFNRAFCYFGIEKYDMAISDYSAVSEHTKSQDSKIKSLGVRARVSRAIIYSMIGRKSEAKEELDEMLQLPKLSKDDLESVNKAVSLVKKWETPPEPELLKNKTKKTIRKKRKIRPNSLDDDTKEA